MRRGKDEHRKKEKEEGKFDNEWRKNEKIAEGKTRDAVIKEEKKEGRKERSEELTIER